MGFETLNSGVDEVSCLQVNDVMSIGKSYQRFGGAFYFHLHNFCGSLSAVLFFCQKVEYLHAEYCVSKFPETSVNFYQFMAHHNIPGG
jgi:hypothetical protein